MMAYDPAAWQNFYLHGGYTRTRLPLIPASEAHHQRGLIPC